MVDSRIRVMIVDDHDMVRNGLTILLEAFEDLDLVGTAADGQEAVELCDRIEADVVLMDLTCPRWTASPPSGSYANAIPRSGSWP